MKNYTAIFRLCIIIILIQSINFGYASGQIRQYYRLSVYHFKDSTQERILDNYFSGALLPALHRMKIPSVGVFKSLANDTVSDKTIYVFISFSSAGEIQKLNDDLEKDKTYQASGHEYIDAVFSTPPYTRIETIILYAFPLAPQMQLPRLRSAKNERVYELRSYESATEKIFQNKVKMFNVGDEVGLFKRLGFNAVFYSEVIAGPRMPNLMYMTTFENMEDREKHWKMFSNDEQWKKLTAMPEYQKNVQHADIIFLRPTDYSDI
jgi:NIPSNAP protein